MALATMHALATTPLAVDTTDALATLHAQMEDMQQGSTRVAFALASPGNRRSTAGGGYNLRAFDRMVRNPTYAPLLSCRGYQVLRTRQSGDQFSALVSVLLAGGQLRAFEFVMSLQPSHVVDEHQLLEPYQMARGHAPVWRTDSVVPSRT